MTTTIFQRLLNVAVAGDVDVDVGLRSSGSGSSSGSSSNSGSGSSKKNDQEEQRRRQLRDPNNKTILLLDNHSNSSNDKDDVRVRGRKKASVLVLISSDGYVLLTKRSPHLRSHPGQVALPGGKQDPEDHGDFIKTALRETYEEVGIDFRRSNNTNNSQDQQQNQHHHPEPEPEPEPEQQDQYPELHIIGRLFPPVISINNLSVVAVIGCTPFATKSQLDRLIKINKDEVSDWFWTPLSYFYFCCCGDPAPATKEETGTGTGTILQLKQIYDIWWHDQIFTYRHYDFQYLREDHKDDDIDEDIDEDDNKNNNNNDIRNNWSDCTSIVRIVMPSIF